MGRAVIEPKVVLCTDLEGDLEEGLRVATRLSLDRAATLVLLHVAPLSPRSGDGMLHESLDLASGRRARALDELVPPDPSVPIERMLEVGDPEERIPHVAEREGAVLLVMELRRHWLRRSLVQRISERVDCPIVTYRARPGRKERPRDAPPPSARARVGTGERLELLEGLLDARVLALSTWLEHRRDAARRVAESSGVRDTVASLLRGGAVLADRHLRLLTLILREHRGALGAVGVEARAPDGAPLFVDGDHAPTDEPRRALEARARADGAAVSLPRDGDPAQPEARLLIEAAAAIPLGAGAPGLVIFSFDARRDFLRILAQPGPTPSTETYAFDDHGLMLSNSHFPEELRRMGLLPRERAVQAPGRVHVREPARPGQEPPLTRMAAAATRGADGRDEDGYLDYRGVPVIGVWRWIPELGFGVAAEMDLDEQATAASHVPSTR